MDWTGCEHRYTSEVCDECAETIEKDGPAQSRRTITNLRAERDELREREDALNTRLDWMEGVMTASEKQKSAALVKVCVKDIGNDTNG